MYRSDEDRLADILMGDAVLQLLQTRSPVTTRALLDKLHKMAAQEPDVQRQNALRRAMAEVMNNMDAPEESGTPLKTADNVTHIFRRRDGEGNDTKH